MHGLEGQPTKDINLTIMSDMEAVSKFFADSDSGEVSVSRLMYLRIVTPFVVALRQNVNRQTLGLQPFTTIVLGDMNLRSSERGINSLFSQTINRVARTYGKCFNRVIVCSGNLSTRLHVETEAGM